MNKINLSPEELEAESLRLHNSRQKMNKVLIQAVEEMMKNPLTAEQMRAQIERNHAATDKNRRLRLYIDIIETDEHGNRKEYKEGTHKQILVYGYKKNFSDKRVVAKSEIFKDTGSVSYRNYKWIFDGRKLSKVK